MTSKYNTYFYTIFLIFVMFFLYTITHFIGILNFDSIHLVFGILSLIFTVTILFKFSIQEFRKKINKENYFRSMIFPISYTLVNIISFLIFADKSTGWEYELGFQATLIWSLLIFVIIATTNLLISKKHKN